MATFGNLNFDIATVIAYSANTKSATPYSVSRSGTLQYITVNPAGTITAGRAKLMTYADSASAPGGLLSTSAEIASFDSNIQTAAIGGTFTAGTYWISFITEGHSGAFSGMLGHTAAGSTVFNANTYALGPSDPFGSNASASAHNFSANIVYTPDLPAGSYLGEITGGPGSSAIGTSPFNSDQVWVLKVIPSVSGTISKIIWFMGNDYNGGVTPLARFLVYDNHTVLGVDQPHNLVGSSADVTVMSINENSVNLTSPVTVTAGVPVYIGVQSRLNLQTFITTSQTAFIGTASFSGGAPSIFPAATPVSYSPTFWAEFAPTPIPTPISARVTASSAAVPSLEPVRFNSSALWRTDAVPSQTSTYNEGGVALSWIYETVLLPDNLMMMENMIIESDLSMAFLGSTPVVTVTATDTNEQVLSSIGIAGGEADTLWNSFTWNNAPWNGTGTDISSWDIQWTEPLVFKQLTVTATGVSATGFKIGNLYLKYQILGYLQQLDSGVR